ncbi:MAG TPA: hypothetical protein VGD65_19800 [Chryseosolibacter sp.]
MENEQNKVKEPFSPHETPAPPQIIDPNKRPDEPAKDNPMNAGKRSSADQSERKASKPGDQKEEKKEEKLLGESETEITDETTI